MPGTSLSGARTLPDAMSLMHRSACRRARDLLGDGEPVTTRVQLTIWRQAGPTDATHVPDPHMTCHVSRVRVSAFRIRGRGAGTPGWVDPAQALHRVAGLADVLADRVLATGEQEWVTLRLTSRAKPVRPMIRSLARRHSVSVSTSVRVAACESHFNPRAFAYPYAGVFQQDVRRWDHRARHFGHPGASPFDPYANVDVSLKMARAWGWSHWGCA